MPVSTRLGKLALALIALGAGTNTAAVAAWAAGAAATHQSSATVGAASQPQPFSTADQTNTGANTTSQSNPYRSTRDGSASLNGNGSGNATGKPCAGCVGRADNKFPPGQFPNGSDPNAGYECDTNHGIGQTNPAHTGCTNSTVGGSPGGATGCAAGTMSTGNCSTGGPTLTSGARGAALPRTPQSGAAILLGGLLAAQSPPSATLPGAASAGGTRTSAGLAFTGGDWIELVSIGLGMAAAGLLMTHLSRRRGLRPDAAADGA